MASLSARARLAVVGVTLAILLLAIPATACAFSVETVGVGVLRISRTDETGTVTIRFWARGIPTQLQFADGSFDSTTAASQVGTVSMDGACAQFDYSTGTNAYVLVEADSKVYVMPRTIPSVSVVNAAGQVFGTSGSPPYPFAVSIAPGQSVSVSGSVGVSGTVDVSGTVVTSPSVAASGVSFPATVSVVGTVAPDAATTEARDAGIVAAAVLTFAVCGLLGFKIAGA